MQGTWISNPSAREKRRTLRAPDPNNRNWIEDEQKYGLQMLKKMGWSEGKGLGREEQGQNDHIKMKMRRQQRGIGLERGESDHSRNNTAWLAATSNYDSLLSSLSSAYNAKPADQEGERNGEITNDNSNEEREANSKKKKRRQKRKREADTNVDTKKKRKTKRTIVTQSDNSGKGVARMYGKRVKSKDASSYSTQDLQEILGTRARPHASKSEDVDFGPGNENSNGGGGLGGVGLGCKQQPGNAIASEHRPLSFQGWATIGFVAGGKAFGEEETEAVMEQLSVEGSEGEELDDGKRESEKTARNVAHRDKDKLGKKSKKSTRTSGKTKKKPSKSKKGKKRPNKNEANDKEGKSDKNKIKSRKRKNSQTK